jgi:hypothetical protein
MATSDVDTIIATICPKLDASPMKDVYMDLALDRVSQEYLGKHYNYGYALMASHYYTMDVSRPTGDSGMVTSKTEGRTSISYWNAIDIRSNSDLHMTSYGKRYKSLIRLIAPSALSSSTVDLDTLDVL